MKKSDWKAWIIYVCIAVAIGLAISSCGASKKAVSISKAHIDSSSFANTKKTFEHSRDSVSVVKLQANYKKETETDYVQIDLDSNDVAPPGVPVVRNKKTGKQKMYLPRKKETEWKDLTKSIQTETHSKDDSSTNEQKGTHLKSDKKEVQKNKEKAGFNPLSLLWLLPFIALFLILKKIFKWQIF